MKKFSSKITKSIISIVIVFSMTIADMMYILPTISLAVNSSDQNTSSSNNSNQNNRNLSALKKDPNVILSPDGKQVVAVIQGKNNSFSNQEMKTMFGKTLNPGENANDVINQQAYSQIESKYGFSKDEIDKAKKLHNSMEQFSYELINFDSSAGVTKLSDDAKKNILTLIKNGYTNSQAFAAYISSSILGISIDDLAKSRSDEISAEQQSADPTEVDNNIPKEQNIDYLELSIKMGVPYSVIETYMKSHSINCDDISSKFDSVEKAKFPAPTSLKQNNQANISNNAYIDAKSLSSSGTFTNYTPGKILEKPYTYETNGNLNINVNNGKYVYSETDLSIPGINGLDLNITRHFNSNSAESTDPLSQINPNYQDTDALNVGYIVYQYYNSDRTSEPPQLSPNPVDMSSYTPANGSFLNGLTLDSTTNSGYYMQVKAGQYQYASDLKNSLPMVVATLNSKYGEPSISGAFIPTVIGIAPYCDLAFINQRLPNSFDMNDYGLGQGWTFGFSRIQSYFDGYDWKGKEKLITSDGKSYEINFGINDSNLVDYKLSDMTLKKSDNGYPNANYMLVYKDGKKEYFDLNGRNIAIVDRFGNAITLVYTINSSGAVSSINITDTLGHHIVYANKNLDPNQTYYISGHSNDANYSYNVAWSLTLDGQLIREYYSSLIYTGTGTQILRAVKNENNEITRYVSFVGYLSYNSFLPSASTSDGSMVCVYLTQATYPNGLNMEINEWTLLSERLGTTGYKKYTMVPSVSYYYVDENNNKSNCNYKTYNFSDYSALHSYAVYSTAYLTTETSYLGKYFGSDLYKWETQQTNHYFNSTDHHNTKDVIINYQEIHNNQINSVDDWNRLHTASFLNGSYKTQEKTYTYDGRDLPASINISFYNEGSPTAVMTENHAYTYDDKGNMLSETKPNGQVITSTYDPTYGIPLTQSYSQDANIVILTENTLTTDGKNIATHTVKSNNSLQAKTEYTSYDSAGRLTAERDFSDASNYVVKQYVYDGGAQAKEIRTLGVKDVDGSLIAATPGYGAGIVVQKMDYNDRGWVISQTDPKGNETQMEYDGTGRITKVANPDGSYATYVYDVPNNKVTFTNEVGTALEYRYDPEGNRTGIYDVAGQQLISSMSYDSLNRLIQEIQFSTTGNNKNVYYYYDTNNRLIEKGTTNNGGTLTSQETYEYTYTDNTFKTTKRITGDENSPSVVTTSYADNMGYTLKNGKILGGIEYFDTYTNDYLGNKKTVKTAYTAGLGGAFTNNYTYDFAGRVLSSIDALNHTANNTYDWLGNQLTATDYNGSVSQMTYNVLGQLLKKQAPFSSDGNTTYYAETQYTYDQIGNVITEKVANNQPGMATTWKQTDYSYNNRNKLVMVTTYELGTPENYTQYYYDAVGNTLRMYTGLSSPLTITDLDAVNGSDTNYSVTQYAYNRFSKMTTMTDPLLQVESYTCDINGNTLAKTDRDGNVTTYAYDDLGRPTSVDVVTPDGSGNTGTSYTYTLTGQKRSESNGTGTTLYSYDALGRVATESFSGAGSRTVKTYGYNIGDSRTSFALTADDVQQFSTTYGYDALNRLTSMTEGETMATYGYTVNGNRDYVQYNNGLREEYNYNLANLVTTLTNKNSGGTVSQYTYNYTLDGNQVRKTDQSGKVNAYVYDGLGRLVSEAETSGGQTQTYTYAYDDSNNRSSLTATGPDAYATNYLYDLNNRLVTEAKTISGTSDITSYFYDPNGNQVTKTTARLTVGAGNVSYELTKGLDGSQLNRYNGLNQLVEVESGDDTTTYTYFASGLRASKAVGTTQIEYVLDGDNVALEQSSDAATAESGVTTAKYIRGINLISSIIGSTTSYYLYNAHGDVAQLADAAGTITKSYHYDAFGNEKSIDTDDANPFRYCGEYYDLSSGTYYLRARYYDPTIGRFLSEDTYQGKATDPLSLNLYTYCESDPINAVDPSGHMSMANLNSISYMYQSGVLDAQSVSTGALLLNPFNIFLSFHEIAQMNIAKRLGEMGYTTVLELPVYSKTEKTWWGGAKKFEADVWANGMVWEVKPDAKSGQAQLDKYVLNGDLAYGFSMDPIYGIPIIDDYKMGIVFSGNGQANYFFYKNNDPNDKVESSVVANEYKKKQVKATAVAAGILALGAADDITGIGIADDPVAIAGAFSAASAILAG